MSNGHRLVKLLVRAASVFLLVAALADGVAAQAVSFIARRDFVVGGRPQSVAIGDFNRDGIQDLVAATLGSANVSVSVLLGNRDGTFRTAMNYGGLTLPVFVAVGDFNRDGIQDLAVAHDHGASILVGNADGTFQTPVPVLNAADPGSIAIGDFNKDGFEDLAIAVTINSHPFAPSSANILLGKGDGTFQTVRSFSTGRRSTSLAIGDFNGDGLQDLAVTNSGSADVSILVGNGDGSFQPARDFATGSSPSSVAVGDFNGDGLQDLAVANTAFGSNDVSILVGNGDATFQLPRDFATGSSPSSVAVGDFNGDGLQDLAVANTGSNDVSILVGNGDGTFQPPQDFATGSSPSSVAIGDFNGDGAPDLAVANHGGTFGPGTVSVMINDTRKLNLVNGLVSFQPRSTTFHTMIDPAACPGFVAAFRFDATLTNKSSSPSLADLIVQVATLTNGNLLQNAEGGPSGVGAILAVPSKGGFLDGILSPQESVDVPFVICLKNTQPFTFFVNVLGTEASNINNSLAWR